jgi:glucokinase
LRIPVFVLNDVRVATIGEWIYGAGQGVKDLVVLFVGTGIGGGIVNGGEIMEGCNNSAGELGHITIIMDGRKCHCPNNGCLEAYAGGWAIAERTQEIIRTDPNSGQTLVRLAGSIDNISTLHVSQGFKKNDPLAMEIVKETGRYLSAGIVGIVNAFNPCKMVLGGGVIEGLPNLIQIIKKTTKEMALDVALESLTISKSALGENAGIIGAAALAQQKMKKSQFD